MLHDNEVILDRSNWLVMCAEAIKWDIWYSVKSYTQALRTQADRQRFDVGLREFVP